MDIEITGTVDLFEINAIANIEILGKQKVKRIFFENVKKEDVEFMYSKDKVINILNDLLDGKIRPREYNSEYNILRDFIDEIK